LNFIRGKRGDGGGRADSFDFIECLSCVLGFHHLSFSVKIIHREENRSKGLQIGEMRRVKKGDGELKTRDKQTKVFPS